jgi:hypothetical protein
MGKYYYVPLNWVRKDQPPDEKEENQEGERQYQRKLEKRQAQRRSAEAKFKTSNNYKRIFQDVAERIVKREKRQVLDKAKKTLSERSQQEFDTWLEQYYQEAPEWMKRTIMPALLSYTEAIQALAAEEAGAKVGVTTELVKWMDGYADIWARNYTSSSLRQIRSVIRHANEEGIDLLEAIETRLDEWEERRPEKVASNEVIEAAGVVSKFVFVGAGIRYLRVVNTGSKTCPYCEELDGKIVGIDQPVIAKGDILTAEGEDNAIRVRKPAFTPPFHQKCVCQIVPE